MLSVVKAKYKYGGLSRILTFLNPSFFLNSRSTAFLNIPQPQGMVLGHGQQEIWIFRVELQFIDGISVTHKMSVKALVRRSL